MRDMVEERLVARLREIGDTVPDELPTPVDLDLQVRRRHRRARAARRWSGLAVAASVVVAVTTVAVVHRTTGHHAIRVTDSPTTLLPVHDALVPGTAMLSSRGRYVLAVSDRGHQIATMIGPVRGNIIYARATDDHHALWYLSQKDGPHECGDVVRANIDGKGSKIVTKAAAFDVSPDGSRLALYGSGDLTNGQCSLVQPGAKGEVEVVDIATFESSKLAIGDITSLRWSPDGSSIVAVSCPASGCSLRNIAVPAELGAPLADTAGPKLSPAHTIHSVHVEFGPDGLYALEATNPPGSGSKAIVDAVDRFDLQAPASRVAVFFGGADWRISQVVPTHVGVYVVATPLGRAGTPGLYRVEGGKLVAVRMLPDPGVFTPVTPLAATG